jgi:large subunit ribosomal protein L4
MNNTILNVKYNKSSIGIIHKAYLIKLKNSRKYTASTKTKSEVSGGGKKPWNQKGTGRARAGSIRSPLWVGGGVIFGPKPKKIYKKINIKENKKAILSLFNLKNKFTKILDNNLFEQIYSINKTKKLVEFLLNQNIDINSKLLIIIDKINSNILNTTSNLKNINIILAKSLNIKNLIQHKQILISDLSLNIINKLYAGK